MVRFKLFFVGIDILILSMFVGVVSYEWYRDYNKTEMALKSNVTKEEVSVDNPFYGDNNSSNVVLLDNKIVNNVADLNNWKWPTDSSYTITSYYGSRWNEFHNAIDIYSYSGYGSNVYSANNGTVVAVASNCVAGYVNCNYGRGNYVVIYHNIEDYYTLYNHLSSIVVSVGDDVSGGDVIAKIGNTGNVIPVPTSSNPLGGTHLHFGAFHGNPLSGGKSFNPLSLY